MEYHCEHWNVKWGVAEVDGASWIKDRLDRVGLECASSNRDRTRPVRR
jgi:hypothetical protein